MEVFLNLAVQNYEMHDDNGQMVRRQLSALLPIGGTVLLDHLLSAIAQLNPRKVVVVGGGSASELITLQQMVGDGSRWGFEAIEVQTNLAGSTALQGIRPAFGVIESVPPVVSPTTSIRSEESSTAEMAVDHDLEDEKPVSDNVKLMIDGNRYFDFALDVMVQTLLESRQHENCLVHELNSGIRLKVGAPGSVKTVESIELSFAEKTYELNTPKLYHQLAILSAGRQLKSMKPRGRSNSKNIVKGRMSNIPKAVVVAENLVAGSFCDVHKSCRMRGNVTLGDEVVIDRGTEVVNSVILSGTYIGENLLIKNSIVDGKYIYRVDTGAYLEIQDSFICCSFGDREYFRDAA